jgi:hypothetical protein
VLAVLLTSISFHSVAGVLDRCETYLQRRKLHSLISQNNMLVTSTSPSLLEAFAKSSLEEFRTATLEPAPTPSSDSGSRTLVFRSAYQGAAGSIELMMSPRRAYCSHPSVPTGVMVTSANKDDYRFLDQMFGTLRIVIPFRTNTINTPHANFSSDRRENALLVLPSIEAAWDPTVRAAFPSLSTYDITGQDGMVMTTVKLDDDGHHPKGEMTGQLIMTVQISSFHSSTKGFQRVFSYFMKATQILNKVAPNVFLEYDIPHFRATLESGDELMLHTPFGVLTLEANR